MKNWKSPLFKNDGVKIGAQGVGMNQRTAILMYLLAVVTFQHVKPILERHCVECHAPGNNLDLSRFPFNCKTNDDQPYIVDGMLAKVGSAAPQMPPGNRPKLSASEVNTIQQWRDQGL